MRAGPFVFVEDEYGWHDPAYGVNIQKCSLCGKWKAFRGNLDAKVHHEDPRMAMMQAVMDLWNNATDTIKPGLI